MPVNIWRHHVQLGDLINDFDEEKTPVETVRDAVVTRLREHPFRAEYAEDIVLRGFLDDLAKAVTLEQLNRELNYMRDWADQDHTRVFLCTITGCPDCRADQQDRERTERKPRKCFWVDPAQDPRTHGGYVPSEVVENEYGHTRLDGDPAKFQSPWIWGATVEQAQAHCEQQNASVYGLSPQEALDIVLSSMTAERTGQ